MLNPMPAVNNRSEYLFRFFDSMPEKELQEELSRASLSQSGSRKQMLQRLRDHHRKELIEHRRKNHRNFLTENLYDYLIVIDFECTCELNKYEYDNEIIEFPAVLVSVHGKKIIDTFHAVIHPKKNPTLTEYCTQLTGITQKKVDNAKSFPEVLDEFRAWMSKHGLDGRLKTGGSCRRFCYVTDGPWDIGKFLQSDCLNWGMPIPHDFRYFLNLRRAFVNFYCHARPGKPKPARLPVADLREMLKRLDMQFIGHEHSGMDDTINIARIVIQMLNDNAELRVNEKLVNGARLLPWHRSQLIFTDEMWEKQQNRKTATSEESTAATEDSFHHQTVSRASSAEEHIICSGLESVAIWDDGDEAVEMDEETMTTNGTTSDGNKLATVQNGNREDAGMNNWHAAGGLYKWWDVLPYKLVRVSREQFIGELFLECESCDEEETTTTAA